MFKTLVVALDLEDDGDRALPAVQALAARAALDIDLVTVSAPGMPSAIDAYELERRALRYGWDSGSWTIVHDIDAASGIVEHAARRPAPLLVMATSARRPMSTSVFGSVTRDVLRRSQVPVLLIGPSVSQDHAPPSMSLVVGVDREATNMSTVPAIASWHATFDGPPPHLVDVIGRFDDDQPARRRLDELAAALAGHDIHAAEHVVIADDPITGLDAVAAGVDDPVFVAVSARYTDGRLHWHSTTQRLVAHAPCPVLVVPARPLPAPASPQPGTAGVGEQRAFPRPNHTGRRPAGCRIDVRVKAAEEEVGAAAPQGRAESDRRSDDGQDMIPATATSPDSVLEHLASDGDIIVPLANGEPVAVLDAIEANADRFDRLRIHQMHALHDRSSLHAAFGDRIRHRSYFLSHVTRPCFAAGTIDLVPSNFSEIRDLLIATTRDPLVVAAASPIDRHGYFSLGVSADYTASFIGRARFFLEANPQMPRTFGRNQLHVSQVAGWCEVDRPLLEVAPAPSDDLDVRIAAHVAERIPDGATIQIGIGGIPNAILDSLRDHHDLGVHTELLSDGVVDLVEAGVITGVRKHLNRTKAVGTFALGTARLHRFLDDNPALELWPVRYVNDPRVIATEPGFVSINSTLSVDLIGQCASETIAGHYYSSSGGRADFARGAMYSPGGQGFVVLQSTTDNGRISKITPTLAAGDVVTTIKNTVDKVVTEWGVAELRGRSIRERATALIAIAHPDHLRHCAHHLGYL